MARVRSSSIPVSTINDVQTQEVVEGRPVTFSWTVTLDAGVTIQTVQWFKQPSTLIAERSGSTFTVSSLYSGRIQNPTAETISLQNVGTSDAGTYRCSVILSDLTSLDDTADLTILYPVDGNWSDWGSWSSCSVTCGEGMWTRSRTCTNPAPANGGADCVGQAQESGTCNVGDIWVCPSGKYLL
ncbi:hypothetical protein Bbelb_248070 [Branchiostoma belcheri]|nr:hypothetical protein Bbelb_248070 [Branchiostoma belcheri]